MTSEALARFNAMSYAEAAALLQTCAAVPSWTSDLLDRRPYPDLARLVEEADQLARSWTSREVAAAVAQHPPIGRPPGGDSPEARMSAREQSDAVAGGALAERIRSGNEAYERRFGHVFLIRAAGRSAEEILAELDRRLTNDPSTEQGEVADQLREIALLRLETSLGPEAGP